MNIVEKFKSLKQLKLVTDHDGSWIAYKEEVLKEFEKELILFQQEFALALNEIAEHNLDYHHITPHDKLHQWKELVNESKENQETLLSSGEDTNKIKNI